MNLVSLPDQKGVPGRQGWAESRPSFSRAWPGGEHGKCQLLSFPAGERSPTRPRWPWLLPQVHRCSIWPLVVGRAAFAWATPSPDLLHAEGLRGQGPSLQILAVSGRSSRQTPKLSSAVRQSTGRSWVPFPQVTEHCRQRVPVRAHLPHQAWSARAPQEGDPTTLGRWRGKRRECELEVCPALPSPLEAASGSWALK